ncbi:T9SS type A sorting domain-containing protein [bacterium]|nr:T9SS type A sorting domain-containing protein [bacterium]
MQMSIRFVDVEAFYQGNKGWFRASKVNIKKASYKKRLHFADVILLIFSMRIMTLKNLFTFAVLFVVFGGFCFTAHGQQLVHKKLDFGNVAIATKDSMQLAVSLGNRTSLSVKIRLYGNGFSTQKTQYTLERGKDTAIWVVFSPEQNLTYRAAIFVGFDNNWYLGCGLQGVGALAGKYYSSTTDLWDQELLDELQKITTQGQISLGYNGARDKMYATLDNYNGVVTCIYTGRTATFNTRSGATANGFNCEHTFPQSKFCTASTNMMVADMHHIFPCDGTANSRRSNNPFGVVTSASWTDGGSKLGNGIFEPRDEQKGPTARAMLYMVMRYGDCNNFFKNQEDILRQWANEYLPDNKEQQRNDAIQGFQHNRNPFVDYPFFVDRILSFTGSKIRQTSTEVLLVDTLIGAVPQRVDSSIYIVYLYNSGSEPFDVSEVECAADQYYYTKGSIAPGQTCRIRAAYSGYITSAQQALVHFSQGAIGLRSLTFDARSAVPNVHASTFGVELKGEQLQILNAHEKVNLTIYSMSGQTLYQNTGLSQYNLGNLGLHGLYIISLSDRQTVINKKVVLR